MNAALVFDAFVGRREELNFLCDAHARSLRDGRGAIVLVLGEAGIGKTRLLTEFAARSEERSGAFVRAACEERSSIPFEPFTTILDARGRKRKRGHCCTEPAPMPNWHASAPSRSPAGARPA